MKIRMFFISIICLLCLQGNFFPTLNSAPCRSNDAIQSSLKNISLPFITNQGQYDAQVKFYANTFGGAVFITQTGKLIYNLPRIENGRISQYLALEEVFINGKMSSVFGEEPAVTRTTFFQGNRPAEWQCQLPTFNQIVFGEVFPGIEVKLRVRGKNVEKLFYVAPGASPEAIRIGFKGANHIQINVAGQLEVVTSAGTVTFTRPIAWQEQAHQKIPVAVAYCTSGNEYGFRVGNHDPSRPLIIDPLLAATFLGGSANDGDYYTNVNMVLDASGNVYIAGTTHSANFPTTPGVYNTLSVGNTDVFVAKLNSALTDLIAATYLGGPFGEEGRTLALDGKGHLYVAGNTESAGFPITDDAYDPDYNGGATSPYGSGDIFISKLDTSLSALLSSTFLGGNRQETCSALALDNAGNVYVTGGTGSRNFPVTSGVFDETYRPGGNFGYDVFVARLNPDLTQLLAATFLGGAIDDFCEAMVYDGADHLFLAGWISSSNFPTTTGAYSASYNGGFYDGFITKISLDLTTVPASTFIGGGDWDFCYGMCLDARGNVYVTGHTASRDFPTSPDAYCQAYQGTAGRDIGDDVFVTKLDPQLSTLLGSTYLGGSAWEIGYSLIADARGNIFVGGTTSSANFPTTSNVLDTTYDGGPKYGGDAFISRFNNKLSSLLNSTYLGGNSTEGLGALVLDQNELLYVAGSTNSAEFPVLPNAYDSEHNGSSDVFIIKIDSLLTARAIFPQINAQPTRGHAPLTVQFTDLSSAYQTITGRRWDFDNDGTIDSDGQNPTWTYEMPGVYSVGLEVFCESISTQLIFKDYIQVFDGQSALEFNGQTGCAQCPAAPVLNLTNNFSVEAWIKPTGWGAFPQGGFGRIVDKTSFAVFLIGSRKNYNNFCLAFEADHATGSSLSSTPDYSIELGKWQHVAVTYGDSVVKIYLNGVEQTLTQTKMPAGELKPHPDRELFFGNALNRRYAFDGVIDEIRLWNSVLSPAEIQLVMNQFLQGDEPGLVGYWQLNEGCGEKIVDLTANQLEGQLEDVCWYQGIHLDPPTELAQREIFREYPSTCRLHANYPNPFNPATTITYELPTAGLVRINIYNISGQLIKRLIDATKGAGFHSVRWNGQDEQGKAASAGVYLVRMQTTEAEHTRKILLLK